MNQYVNESMNHNISCMYILYMICEILELLTPLIGFPQELYGYTPFTLPHELLLRYMYVKVYDDVPSIIHIQTP